MHVVTELAELENLIRKKSKIPLWILPVSILQSWLNSLIHIFHEIVKVHSFGMWHIWKKCSPIDLVGDYICDSCGPRMSAHIMPDLSFDFRFLRGALPQPPLGIASRWADFTARVPPVAASDETEVEVLSHYRCAGPRPWTPGICDATTAASFLERGIKSDRWMHVVGCSVK